MVEDLLPTLLPAFMSEWQFMTTTTAPPATGQVRLNHSTQKNALLMWIHKTTINGNDATPYLTTVKQGTVLRLNDKDDLTKWQSFTVSGPPVAKTDYWEYPILWLAGDQALVQQRIIVDIPTVSVSINVTGNGMQALSNGVDAIGQQVTREFAYPFQGLHYTSPGMTLRQYYAGQALTGFIANSVAANLIGNISAYCFKVADSMIAYEALMTGPPPITLRPVPIAPTGVAAPPGQANITMPEEEALAMQTTEKKRLKIIS